MAMLMPSYSKKWQNIQFCISMEWPAQLFSTEPALVILASSLAIMQTDRFPIFFFCLFVCYLINLMPFCAPQNSGCISQPLPSGLTLSHYSNLIFPHTEEVSAVKSLQLCNPLLFVNMLHCHLCCHAQQVYNCNVRNSCKTHRRKNMALMTRSNILPRWLDFFLPSSLSA